MRHKFILGTLGTALLVVGYLATTLLATPSSPVPVLPAASNVKVDYNYNLGRVGGVLTSYTVVEPPDAVHAFYEIALPDLGWLYVAPGTYSPVDSIAEGGLTHVWVFTYFGRVVVNQSPNRPQFHLKSVSTT